MRLAVFTSLNPVRSGISDYSEALLPQLARHFDIDAFIDDYQPVGFGPDAPIQVRHHQEYRPEDFDATLYHIGNNPYHIYMYETVLKYPGIVVLHEFNLHHLIADSTIKRGNWNDYLREAEYNGGTGALAYAKKVQALEVGPDYEGLPMNRRVLESSRAVIVHSHHLVDKIREAGYEMPVRRIPHGVRVPEVNRHVWRAKLGADETTPLIGTFGFMRPHKRIGEVLLAMQRVVRVEPRARLVLAGEEHPNFPVRELIAHLQLEPFVDVLGYVPLDELEGWLAAVDVCVNLRYPSVGETSGTLVRALGLGRAVICSDVGSFSELPDEICLKVPISGGEEALPIGHRPLRIEEVTAHTPGRPEVDRLTEQLLLLVTRPESARAMGRRARQYVAAEWNWRRVSDLYAEWIREVASRSTVASVAAFRDTLKAVAADATVNGVERLRMGAAGKPAKKPESVLLNQETEARPTDSSAEPAAAATPAQEGAGRTGFSDVTAGAAPGVTLPESQLADYIRSFAREQDAAAYVEKHLSRLVRTLQLTPRGSATDAILEMGCYLQITPALRTQLGYGEPRGAYLGPPGTTDHRRVESSTGEVFECFIDLFDAERDRFPYPDSRFTTVLCCELLEHLTTDPMFMMAEVNRILKPGGRLVLSTPNICSLRAVEAILLGYHPGLFHHYVRADVAGQLDPRHNREYTPRDIESLMEAAGFAVETLETGSYAVRPSAQHEWVKNVIQRYDLPADLRGDVIHAAGRKIGEVKDRYPASLYSGEEG